VLRAGSGLSQLVASVKNHAALLAVQQGLQLSNGNQDRVHGHFFHDARMERIFALIQRVSGIALTAKKASRPSCRKPLYLE
jgi:hypothetical protein